MGISEWTEFRLLGIRHFPEMAIVSAGSVVSETLQLELVMPLE